MRIECFIRAMCSIMRMRSSIPMLQKSPFSKISGIIGPDLAGLYPRSKHLPFVFSCKKNVFFVRIVAAGKSNPGRKPQPGKNWLKAKDTLKKTGLNTTEPSLMSENSSCDEDVKLTERQAIGVVVAAQANFMRVIVKKAGGDDEFEQEGSGRGNFGFKGNGAPEKLDEYYMGLGRNIQLNSGLNAETMNGVFENASVTLGDCDNMRGNGDDNVNSYNRISRPDFVMSITGVSRTLEGDGCLDEGKNGAAMGVMPIGYRGEEDDPNNDCHRRNGDICSKELERREGSELLCWVRALLKKIKRRVLVGDKVLVGGIDWADKRGMVEDVFERKSELPDPPVANVDNLIVLFSFDQPKLEPFTLTRFLVEAESTEIPFKLVLNKADLLHKEFLLEWKDRLQTWGYEPLFCSANTDAGLSTVANVLVGRTSVVVGPSGVGKSSLINALRRDLDIFVTNEMDLFAGQVEGSKWFEELRVGEISARSGRGKHTTRNVTLLPLSSGGYLTDTPGMSQPSLLKVTKNSLGWMFPEIRQMVNSSESGRCRFRDCLHMGEPGCAVKGDWERYPYYLQLLDEIKIREEIQLRLIGTKRESDVRYKIREMGVKQAEPRLEPKKHRRLSRKRINQSIEEELNKELEDYED